ncbi:hypothetical protein [Marinomonas spartinae]|uniref:hypothetical protein n=1 Tax=Marinomonas spartinae TaxID=1792290 RepID=UPI001586A01C|nr:hypothetical protein [Marinomonas spartinae]
MPADIGGGDRATDGALFVGLLAAQGGHDGDAFADYASHGGEVVRVEGGITLLVLLSNGLLPREYLPV